MKRWVSILALVVITWGFVGCGGSADKPRTDAEGKAIKPPETPPNGV